ncbi:MAG: hypothetical protein ACKVS6_04840, partial [Planctomycetota bacterium]
CSFLLTLRQAVLGVSSYYASNAFPRFNKKFLYLNNRALLPQADKSILSGSLNALSIIMDE